MQQWIIQAQKRIHYIILVLSISIVLISIWLTFRLSAANLFLLTIPAVLLLFTSLVYSFFLERYHRYRHYCKRIRYEYIRVVNKQSYKLERLTGLEYRVLLCILEDYEQEDLRLKTQLSYTSLYYCIRNIKTKLEIPNDESPLDIDWNKIM